MVVLSYLDILLLILAGFSSGIIISICSGTVAVIMIPVLTLLLGYQIHYSVGTSLAIDCIIGLIAGLFFFRNRKTKVKPIVILAITAVFGAFIGSNYTAATPKSLLNLFIGFILIVLGISFVLKGIQRNIEYIKSKYSFEIFKKHKKVTLICFGLTIGFISGLTGIAGGSFIAIIVIFLLDYDLHTAIGTSLIMLFLIAGSGAVGHILKNEIIFPVFILAGVAGVIGASTGSIYANRLDEQKLGRVIGVIILLLGMTVLIKTL